MARILVIDNEEDVRRVVDVMLKNAGHDTVLAVVCDSSNNSIST